MQIRMSRRSQQTIRVRFPGVALEEQEFRQQRSVPEHSKPARDRSRRKVPKLADEVPVALGFKPQVWKRRRIGQ